MNKRDFFKILPGMFFIPTTNIEFNKGAKSLSFCLKSTNFIIEERIIKDDNNVLTFKVEYDKKFNISKIDGVLNGVDVDVLSMDLKLDIPPRDIKSYGTFGVREKPLIADNTRWVCRISYKER